MSTTGIAVMGKSGSSGVHQLLLEAEFSAEDKGLYCMWITLYWARGRAESFSLCLVSHTEGCSHLFLLESRLHHWPRYGLCVDIPPVPHVVVGETFQSLGV